MIGQSQCKLSISLKLACCQSLQQVRPHLFKVMRARLLRPKFSLFLGQGTEHDTNPTADYHFTEIMNVRNPLNSKLWQFDTIVLRKGQ